MIKWISRKLWGYYYGTFRDILKFIIRPNLLYKTIHLEGQWYKGDYLTPDDVYVYKRDIRYRDGWWVRARSGTCMSYSGRFLRNKGLS